MSGLVHVKGLSELNKVLQSLPAKVEQNVLRGALRAGALVIEQEAKAQVPVKTGTLRDSIKTRTKSKGGKVIAAIQAGGKSGKKGVMQAQSGRLYAGWKQAFYAHMIEYGTAPHKITAKDGGWLSFGGVFAKSIEHPGIAPRPFMRPALDSRAHAAVLAAANYMKARLASKHGLDTADIQIGDEE